MDGVAGAAEIVAELERRAEQTLGASGVPSAAEARDLAGLESDLRAATTRLAEAGLWTERGHPVLGDVAVFRDRAREAGAAAAAQRAEELARALVEDYAAAFRREAEELPADDPEAAFRAIARARVLDLEALARTGGGPPLADARPALRQRMLAACEARPPDATLRDAWARELLDRADAVLASLEDVEPTRAADIAEVVADDLRWHVKAIEHDGGWRRRRLARRTRRLRAEAQERHLQARLETRFGRRNVARFERTIIVLTLAVLGILAAEAFFTLPPAMLFWMAVADTLACLVFLWEAGVKTYYARDRRRWVWRHLFVDILPSIPFSLLLLHHSALDTVRVGRAFRLVRLTRVGRYLYILRPFLRLGRAFGFLSRGLDRLIRRYGAALNRNVILYPTREERRALATTERDGPEECLRRLASRVQERWLQVVTEAGDAAEEVAGARVAALTGARARGDLRSRPAAEPAEMAGRDVIAEQVLRRLERVTPEEAEARLGQDLVARIARVVKIVSLPPLRWLPVLRRYVPRLAEDMSEAQVVAAAARAAAAGLRRVHGRWLWFADLYGTITPAQFVDRVGSALVKVAFRPAYRLVLFALIVLVFRVIFEVSGLSWLDRLSEAIFEFVGVLGAICLLLLGAGWWLKRIAGEATAFFEQAASAQYLALTESFKRRTLSRDLELLDRRVLAPERLLDGGAAGEPRGDTMVARVRDWLAGADVGVAGDDIHEPAERTLLLYRDGLDGGPFTDEDTRTTAQLLGNPALCNLRAASTRFTPRDERQLLKLDLERPTALFGGPYFWFRLMCRAMAHGVARLVVDFNRHALPLAQLATAAPDERARYEAWLRAEEVAEVRSTGVRYVTTQFTALHFLDDDPRRDEEVGARFGPEVLARVQRDRRLLFRRVFGTYPVHKLPRDDRVFNPYRVHQRYLAGGRALLVPFYVLWGAFAHVRAFFAWLRRCVRELKGPSVYVDVEAAEGADFAAAVRKIRRMRRPVAEAALRLRLRFDPEYLGVRLPGTGESGLERAEVDDDLRFLDAGANLRREVEAERARTERDMRRLATLIADGLLARLVGGQPSRAHLRAAACAYHADLDGVRSLLSAREILLDVCARAAREGLRPRAPIPSPRLHGLFRKYWARHGKGGLRERRAAWRAIAHDVDGAAHALRVWAARGDARTEGEAALANLLRHPERITEQLVTLRTVQTLTLIDILVYREHVYRLGRYAESGDDAAHALDLV